MSVTHRLFRPLGPAQLDRVGSSLLQSHALWCRHWFIGDRERPVELDCVAAERSSAAVQSGWHAVETAGGTAYVSLPEDLCSRILDAWLDAAPNEAWRAGSAAGASLVQRVVGDWLLRLPHEGRRVPAASQGQGGTAFQAPPAELFLPFSGAAAVTLRTWFGGLDMLLAPELVRSVQMPGMPPRGPDRRPLISRHDAIRSAKLKIRVQGSADARLSLGVLHSLAVGDVILLEPNVSDPWTVADAKGQKITLGFIGRRGQGRAIILSGIKES